MINLLESWHHIDLHPAVVVVGALLLPGVAALLLVRYHFSRLRWSQQWRLIAAQDRLTKLKKIQSQPQLFRYIRKIDAFVFEEMILFAFEALGCDIRRNSRYTGDGGVDGRFRYQGAQYLIQAKNYSGFIQTADIKSLSEQSSAAEAIGVFVHTGKTRPATWRIARQQNVVVISGSAVLALLLGTSSADELLGE